MVAQWLAPSLTARRFRVRIPWGGGATVKRHAICGKCELTALKMSEGVNVRADACWPCLEPRRAHAGQMQLGIGSSIQCACLIPPPPHLLSVSARWHQLPAPLLKWYQWQQHTKKGINAGERREAKVPFFCFCKYSSGKNGETPAFFILNSSHKQGYYTKSWFLNSSPVKTLVLCCFQVNMILMNTLHFFFFAV